MITGHVYLDEQNKVMDKLMPDYLHQNAEGATKETEIGDL